MLAPNASTTSYLSRLGFERLSAHDDVLQGNCFVRPFLMRGLPIRDFVVVSSRRVTSAQELAEYEAEIARGLGLQVSIPSSLKNTVFVVLPAANMPSMQAPLPLLSRGAVKFVILFGDASGVSIHARSNVWGQHVGDRLFAQALWYGFDDPPRVSATELLRVAPFAIGIAILAGAALGIAITV